MRPESRCSMLISLVWSPPCSVQRYRGTVSTICLSASQKPPSFDAADTLIIGDASKILVAGELITHQGHSVTAALAFAHDIAPVQVLSVFHPRALHACRPRFHVLWRSHCCLFSATELKPLHSGITCSSHQNYIIQCVYLVHSLTRHCDVHSNQSSAQTCFECGRHSSGC